MAYEELNELDGAFNFISVITQEELNRMEEEREDMLRWIPFNEAEDEQ